MSVKANVEARSEIDVAECVRRLTVDGYVIITGWLDQASSGHLRSKIDDYVDGNSENVQHNADDRIIGFEHLDPLAENYKHDAFLEEVASTYMNGEQKVFFTMANRVKVVPGKTVRSGGRWHRDRKARQFKSLTYLSDVKVENGAFCIIPRSARPEPFEPAIRETRFEFEGQRWDDRDINPFLKRIEDNVLPIEGPTGTCVMFDSSLIHSGLPISAGTRYAMTNYYYGPGELNLEKMRVKMAPAVKPLEMPVFATA